MKRTVQLFLQTLLIGVILLASGCKFPPRPIHFSNMIWRGNERLSEAATNFAKALEPLNKNLPAKVDSAQNAYKQMETALSELKQEFDAVSPPLNSDSGKELLEKYRAYLQTEQSIFDSCFTPIMSCLKDDARYPTPALKSAVINPLLLKAASDEKEPARQLFNAHKEFCTKHRLEAKTR